MNQLLELESAGLHELHKELQTKVNGGALPLVLEFAAVSPIATIYACALAASYYIGYGAHSVYNYINQKN